jgi:hypothetical protein
VVELVQRLHLASSRGVLAFIRYPGLPRFPQMGILIKREEAKVAKSASGE